MILIQILTVMFFTSLSIFYVIAACKDAYKIAYSPNTIPFIIWLTLAICSSVFFFVTQSLTILISIVVIGCLVISALFVYQNRELYAIISGITSFILLALANFVF